MSARGRRAGQYARSRARHQYIEHVRVNWRLYVLTFGSVYVVTFMLHRVWPRQFSNVFVGSMLVVPLWIVSLVVVGRPGSAAWARGADAEEWTRSALRRALGRRYVIVHDIQLGSGNIDHVVIGPAGVFVVETKWSGERWASPEGASRIDTARKQAKDGARRVQRALDAAGVVALPRPVVVLWGGGTRDWTPNRRSWGACKAMYPRFRERRFDPGRPPLAWACSTPGRRRDIAQVIETMSVTKRTTTT